MKLFKNYYLRICKCYKTFSLGTYYAKIVKPECAKIIIVIYVARAGSVVVKSLTARLQVLVS